MDHHYSGKKKKRRTKTPRTANFFYFWKTVVIFIFFQGLLMVFFISSTKQKQSLPFWSIFPTLKKITEVFNNLDQQDLSVSLDLNLSGDICRDLDNLFILLQMVVNYTKARILSFNPSNVMKSLLHDKWFK